MMCQCGGGDLQSGLELLLYSLILLIVFDHRILTDILLCEIFGWPKFGAPDVYNHN